MIIPLSLSQVLWRRAAGWIQTSLFILISGVFFVNRRIRLTNHLFAEDGEEVERILRLAVHHALLRHKRLGNPIAVWKDGRVVIIPPEEIQVTGPHEPSQTHT